MTTNFERVQEFVKTFDANHAPWLWLKLINEEHEELLQAVEAEDWTAIADALADLEYVIHGMSYSLGNPADEIFQEVHRSNMTKLGEDGKPIKREDGKILKGPNYDPPHLEQFLIRKSL